MTLHFLFFDIFLCVWGIVRIRPGGHRRNESKQERNGTMKERVFCIGGYMLAAVISVALLAAVAELSMGDGASYVELEFSSEV